MSTLRAGSYANRRSWCAGGGRRGGAPQRAPSLHRARRAPPQPQAAASAPPAAPLGDRGPEAALLLAWHASKNRSLFAAQCFAEAVLEAYRRGATVDDLEVRAAVWLAAPRRFF